MTLDVIIATYKPEGIRRLAEMELPEMENVNYIISWQAHENYPFPASLQRKDIRICRLDGIGLSRNRNNAIAQSKADIVYIADDDIKIMPNSLATIIRRFEENPDTDLATFRINESLKKKYPDKTVDLSYGLPPGYYVSSIELAFRRGIFPKIKFNENFGINSGLFELGEDELFHLQARKSGLKCRFFPDLIASHPHESTGSRFINNPKVLHGMGAVVTKSYPRSFLFRIPLKAYRLTKNRQTRFFTALHHLFVGSIKSYKIKL